MTTVSHIIFVIYDTAWNPKDQQEEDDIEAVGLRVKVRAAATAVAVAEEEEEKKRLCQDLFVFVYFFLLSVKEEEEEEEVVITNDMKLMWEESKEDGVFSVAREVQVIFFLYNQCYSYS